MMSSNGAADLLADWHRGASAARYAPAFHLDRHKDPAYQKPPEDWGDSG
jgi:hypothetical protein